MRNMTLGFHYHVPAEQRGDKIYMPAFQGRFLDALALRCREIICLLHDRPRTEEIPMMDYCIRGSNIKLAGLGPHDSVPARLIRGDRIIQQARSKSPALDALLLRGPSPLLPNAARVYSQTPLVLLLVGDLSKGLEDLPGSPVKKAGIKLWAHWNKCQQNKLLPKCLTFVNSRQIYRELQSKTKNIFEISTTLLSENDFECREDTCQRSSVRLLYVGRMTRSKGVIDAIEALSLLRKEGLDAVLDLVGPQEKGDSLAGDWASLAKQKSVEKFVFYHGYHPVGPDLFKFYRESDILLVPSQQEGFPRVIWEAMANGLPVIATRVGSIPDYLENEKHAILIDAGEPLQIGEAVKKIIQFPDLRRKITSQGFELARKFTLENQAQLMIDRIYRWLNEPLG